MALREVVYLMEFTDILFTVYGCKCCIQSQNKYSKNIERMPSKINK